MELTYKVKETVNPNDWESQKAVELRFYCKEKDYRELFISKFDLPKDKREDLKEISDSVEHYVGRACVSSIDCQDPFLYDFEVEKSTRNLGYGKAMMHIILDTYKPKVLSVLIDNLAAIHLYKMFGFHIEGSYSVKENGREYIYYKMAR